MTIMDSKYPANLDELVQDMEQHPELYHHLKIFLRHENTTCIPDFGEEYLVVNGNGFGVYSLNDIDYNDGRIVLSLTERDTKLPALITLDVDDKQPNIHLIRWHDVKEMVYAESTYTRLNIEDLLEINE
jgi:hypothetical protein